MTSHKYRELFAAILRTHVRIEDILKDAKTDDKTIPGVLTYMESIENAIFLSPDIINVLFRTLLDLSQALQLIYIDSTYRSNLQFNSSLDLSEIYSYSNPSPSRTWSKIVRFSILHHDRKNTCYNVLPTTVLEVLSFLRRFYRSCKNYENYSELEELLSNPSIKGSEGLEELDELPVPLIEEFSDALPLSSFLSLIKSTSSQASPKNPARALFDLIRDGDVRPIDEEIREVLGKGAVKLNQYNEQYYNVLRKLEKARAGRSFNNSVDARSYQLSLALNDLAHSQKRFTYMPILSSGMPLNEFANIGWSMDPLMDNPKLEEDDIFNFTDVRARRIFSTARSPHYHYLKTLLLLKYPDDPAAIAKYAKDNVLKVKKAIDDWSDTIHKLNFKRTKSGPLGRVRELILRIDKGQISEDTKLLLEMEESARSRIENQDEFRYWFKEGRGWIYRHFPNRNAYDNVIRKNYDDIRNQIFKSFSYLENSIQLLLEAEERVQGPMLPDIKDLISWTTDLIKGKEE